jgi:hypothetical protein
MDSNRRMVTPFCEIAEVNSCKAQTTGTAETRGSLALATKEIPGLRPDCETAAALLSNAPSERAVTCRNFRRDKRSFFMSPIVIRF